MDKYISSIKRFINKNINKQNTKEFLLNHKNTLIVIVANQSIVGGQVGTITNINMYYFVEDKNASVTTAKLQNDMEASFGPSADSCDSTHGCVFGDYSCKVYNNEVDSEVLDLSTYYYYIISNNKSAWCGYNRA